MDSDKKIHEAYASILKHDFEKAIAWFEEAVAENPENADYHYKLSITYARSGKLEKAYEHSKEAVKLSPDKQEYRLHNQHLKSLQLTVDAEKIIQSKMPDRLPYGIDLLKKAIELDPLSIEAYVLLGYAYENTGQFDQAKRVWKQALELDPKHPAILQFKIKGEHVTDEQHGK